MLVVKFVVEVVSGRVMKGVYNVVCSELVMESF